MDAIERKALSLSRERSNHVCETCRHKNGAECEIMTDSNKCIYNDMEFWQPNTAVFLELAEKILER